MRSAAFLVAFVGLVANVEAGTVCNDGQCFSCEGSAVCINGDCTCNGAPLSQRNARVDQEPCIGQLTAVHRNGGGKKSVKATVEPSVFVSEDSAVCGEAIVSGLTEIKNGSLVNGRAHISDSSSINHSTVNGDSIVSQSLLSESTVNGNARVSHSKVVESTLNGQAVVTDSDVKRSIINGHTSVVGRTIQGSVLNN